MAKSAFESLTRDLRKSFKHFSKKVKKKNSKFGKSGRDSSSCNNGCCNGCQNNCQNGMYPGGNIPGWGRFGGFFPFIFQPGRPMWFYFVISPKMCAVWAILIILLLSGMSIYGLILVLLMGFIFFLI